MKRPDLEHVVRASGAIVGASVVVVIGSQAILGSHPDPPPELTVSMEADVYVPGAPGTADLITGSIGEFSPFHQAFGYFADGVDPGTATLPRGWEQRLVRLENENTNGITAMCLSPLDIGVSKLAAGRPKDMKFVTAMLRHGILEADEVGAVLPDVPGPHRDLIAERLKVVMAMAAT